MKLTSSKFFLVIASAALLFAGCSKKPVRPEPSATLGLPANNTPLDNSIINTNPAGTTLEQRTDGFDANNQNRTALQPIYFDFDQSAIKQAEREKLKAAKEYLEKNPGTRLLLEGHCDWRGTAEYNLGLGDRRAAAAKKYLTSIGVPADKLETLSKGSLDATKDADDATRAKDRRVDLVVSKAK